MNTRARHRHARLAACAFIAMCGARVVTSAPAGTTADIDVVMARVCDRVLDYYRRAQSVVWIESSTVQPIQRNWTPDGFARTVESELRVEWPPPDGTQPEPKVIRNIRRINGRAPRERDNKDRSGCTDPELASPEPLAFLLALHRNEYRFVSVARGTEKHRAALVVDFKSTDRTSSPELVQDERGHDDCFGWKGPVATSGRLWVDPTSFEVLRVERHNEGPVDVRVPVTLQRQYRLPPWVTIDRDDVTMRYTAVAFSDPDETILLPESLDALTVLRSGLQSIRRTETFGGYRRFLTTGRIVKDR